MTKATDDKLGELHGKLAEAFEAKLKDPTTLTAADFNVIRQFLKDNGINASPTKDNPLGKLLSSLPQLPEDDQETTYQ